MPLFVYVSALVLALAAGAGIVWKYLVETGLLHRPGFLCAEGPVIPRSEFRWRALVPGLWVLLVSRLLVLVVSYVGAVLFQSNNAWNLPSLDGLWDRWDSPHYLDLAREGYVNQGDPQNFIVFLPLFPAAVWLFHWVTQDLFTVALVVSHLAFFAGGYFLHRILDRDYGAETAFRGVCFYAFTPFGFFLGLGFTEGLFLAVTLGGYWAAREHRWGWAGLCLFLAALTKVQGVLLVVPVAMEWFLAEKKRWPQALALVGSLLGVGIYLGINQAVFGNPFHFLAVQRDHWGQNFGFFPENLMNQVGCVTGMGSVMAVFLWIPQIFGFLITVFLILGTLCRTRASASAYLLAYLLVSYSATWLLSGNRYLAAAFPVAILWARASESRLAFAILLALSAGLLTLFTLGFIQGSSIM